MRALLILVGLAAVAVIGAWSLGLINIDQIRVAQAPPLTTEIGQAPEFTVNLAKMEIATENKMIAVPTMTVEKPGNGQEAPATE